MHANLIDAQEDASEFEGLVTSIQEKVKEAKRRHSLFWPHPLPLLGLPRPLYLHRSLLTQSDIIAPERGKKEAAFSVLRLLLLL